MQQELSPESRLAILDALGLSLTSKRKEDIAFRAASGIETEWQGDTEFYQGYDDANRNEFVNTASKPAVSSEEIPQVNSGGSTIFPNITQPYCDAVSARVGDMLLPTDDRNYALEPTPIPEMMPEAEQPGIPQGIPQAVAPPQGAMPPGVQPGMPPGQPTPPAPPPVSQEQEAKAKHSKMMALAEKKAKKAEDHINDWLTECQYHGEARKVIDDVVLLGSGVIKGPVPVMRKSKQTRDTPGGLATVMIEEIVPASFRIDTWNLFPDAACGENIHNGSRIWERAYLTPKKLQALKGLPGYIDSQIDLCIDEGPKGDQEGDARNLPVQGRKDRFVIWYVHISIKAEEMMAAGCDCSNEKAEYPAMLAMVNDRVVQASLNPSSSGEFPYDLMPFKRRPGMPWGMGLARQLRAPQRLVVGATRRLADNAGLGSGPQIVVRRGVKPFNGTWEVTPLKIWVEDDDSSGNATAPVSAVVIPMLQRELTEIIQLGMKMAEDVTGMPLLMQGQQGKAPDTVGGMTILNNNANAVLRRIARLFDSSITEPHLRRYYDWLMEYGEDDNEKGDFQISARGSTALVERDLQSQEMINVLNLSLNPSFGKNPRLAMNEYLKSRRFNPEAFDYTEEEQQKIDSQPQQLPPQVQAAQIREQGQLEREKMESKQINDRIAAEASLEMHRMKFERAENELDRQNKLAVAVIDERMKSTELTSAERQTLNKIKAELAGKSMSLNVQQQLSRESMAQANDHTTAKHKVDIFKHTNPQVAKPMAEPRGRAPAGQAFVK